MPQPLCRPIPHRQPLPCEPTRVPSARTCAFLYIDISSSTGEVSGVVACRLACHLSSLSTFPSKSHAPTGTITTPAAFAKYCPNSVAYRTLGLRERIVFIVVACPVYQLATPNFALSHPAEPSVPADFVLWYRRARAIKVMRVHALPRGTSQRTW